MNFLQQLDAQIFTFINGSYHSDILDRLMIGLSSEYFAALMTLVVSVWIFKNNKNNFWKNIIFIALTIGAMDILSSYGLKPTFERLRPCRLEDFARLIGGCAGWYGFPSNHAANSMAAATLTWAMSYRRLAKLLLGVALVVGLSRIYLGVHYPFDVLGGFVIGGCWGFGVGKLWTMPKGK